MHRLCGACARFNKVTENGRLSCIHTLHTPYNWRISGPMFGNFYTLKFFIPRNEYVSSHGNYRQSRTCKYTKKQWHAVFPCGHPSRYLPRPTLFYYGDRTGTGTFNVVWSLHINIIFNYKYIIIQFLYCLNEDTLI